MALARFALRGTEETVALMSDAVVQNLSVSWADEHGGIGVSQLEMDGAEVVLRSSDGRAPQAATELSFTLYGLPVTVACRVDQGRMDSSLKVWSADQRGSPRVAPAREFVLEWTDVVGGSLRTHSAKLNDISAYGGRSFHPSGAPVPSQSAFAATISSREHFFHCMVEVRSRHETPGGVELGLSIRTAGSTTLADSLLQTMFPKLIQRREVAPDQVAELFERSRYLSLRDGCALSASWLGLDADGISRDFVYMADEGLPVGHGSITRAYRNTWLAHQIATLSSHRDSMDARRSLYMSLTLTPTLLDGKTGNMIAYYDRSLSWHQVFFEEFARSVPSTSHAVVTGLNRFERSAAPLGSAPELPDGVQVERAGPRDMAVATSLARSTLPPLLCDAIDLFPETLQTDALHECYRGPELFRGREVFVARSHGRIVAIALCEYTDRSLSLFNIMNLAYMFVASADVSPAVQLALQHSVRSFYLARGIVDPIIVSPEDNFDATLDPEVQLAEVMGCLVWSAQGLRAYENYVRLRFAWLQQGRRATGASRYALRDSAVGQTAAT